MAPPHRCVHRCPAAGGVRLLVLVLLLFGAAGAVAWWFVTRARSPEARAVHYLRAELLARQAPGGTFGHMIHAAPDYWTTGEAAAALAACFEPADRERLRHQIAYCLQGALAAPFPGTGLEAPHGGWPLDLSADTIGGGEPSGWVGTAVGMAWLRLGAELHEAAARTRAFLLAIQNPDGSFSSVLIGPQAARTSASQDCLLALLVLESVPPVPSPEGAAAIERAARWFGDTFDLEAGVWYPRVRRGWRQRHTVPGLSEMSAWLLLEARDVLARAGRALAPSATRALQQYAARYEPDRREELATVLPADRQDYQFDLPPGAVTMWGKFGHRWSWYVYRALCSTRLAASTGLPRTAAWAGEAAWLREQLPRYLQALRDAPTFQLAESLLMAAILAYRPLGHPARGSLVDLVRSEAARRGGLSGSMR
ncbi:MAG: hypothetical protein KatS3mg102_1352 [Planctomycetota bacterium]|nr:MAG: hypothetical protein KatS3mg102_1352 [Planctomycetota bacterium]